MGEKESSGKKFVREGYKGQVANMAREILNRGDIDQLSSLEQKILAQNTLKYLPMTVKSLVHTKYEGFQANREEGTLEVTEEDVFKWVEAVNGSEFHIWDCPPERY